VLRCYFVTEAVMERQVYGSSTFLIYKKKNLTLDAQMISQ
jgi:hypothetical protein